LNKLSDKNCDYRSAHSRPVCIYHFKILNEYAIGKCITDLGTIKRLEIRELEKQMEEFMDYIQYK
jgi:hypothetical protein